MKEFEYFKDRRVFFRPMHMQGDTGYSKEHFVRYKDVIVGEVAVWDWDSETPLKRDKQGLPVGKIKIIGG